MVNYNLRPGSFAAAPAAIFLLSNHPFTHRRPLDEIKAFCDLMIQKGSVLKEKETRSREKSSSKDVQPPRKKQRP
jgi:hypothetical protein